MKLTPEQQQQQEAEYAAAFGDDMEPAPEAEEAMPEGAMPTDAGSDMPPVESEATEASETPAAEAAETPMEQQAEAEAGTEQPMEPAADAPAEAPAEAAPALDIEKERQRLKSWEGRLKAMEADLKARAQQQPAESGDKAEQTAEVLEEVAGDTNNQALTHAALDAAEQVEQGEMTPQQAMTQLAEDFGPDFVKMIEAIAMAKAHEIAGRAADEKVGQVGGTVQQLIDALNDERLESHFNAIAEAHPDFDDIGKSEGFKAFILAMPDDERAEAERISGSGTAKEIVGLLNAYKKSQHQGDAEEAAPQPEDDDALAAAEGVRSTGGIKLPEQPVKGGSYEDAWSQF